MCRNLNFAIAIQSDHQNKKKSAAYKSVLSSQCFVYFATIIYFFIGVHESGRHLFRILPLAIALTFAGTIENSK